MRQIWECATQTNRQLILGHSDRFGNPDGQSSQDIELEWSVKLLMQKSYLFFFDCQIRKSHKNLPAINPLG
jgi:hypothetical protein